MTTPRASSDYRTEPARVQIVDDGAKAAPRPDDCGGALLRTTRAGIENYRRNGVYFTTIDEHDTGDLTARVQCRGTVETKTNAHGMLVRFGLCAACSALEADVRRALRDRREQQRDRGGRAA